VDLRAQIGQLLWCGFPGTDVPPAFASRLRAGEVGLVILFRPNLASIEQTIAINRRVHELAPGVLIAVDQEGGRVARVREPATLWPPMLSLGETGDEALAEEVGRAMGLELAALGFDVDFAPVLDVHTNPANPIIGDRAFGTTPEAVVKMAGAWARGLASAGILGCGKHFPGHGDTTTDSHLALPRISHPMERLERVELVPFARVKLPMIMTAHVIFDAVEPGVPATLSAAALQKILRGKLGFDGVIVSDDLEMKAIADHFGFAEALERGLLAGCDAFLICHEERLQLEAMEILLKAAERSSAVRDRIAEACARIEKMKRDRPQLVGSARHQALSRAASGSPR
jgi:beta-N-acetylhexosaminidase